MSSQESTSVDDTVAVTPSKPSNVFGNALQSWVEIDLPSLQKKLDDQGLHLKEEQKTSLISRKNLAAKTKEFRKLDDGDKLQEWKGLLKLYQNEIDNLTNKNKTVENYFFGIYRLLAEAPDPRPLLEMSLDSVLESKEASTLREQVDKLNNELARKADYDQLKQRLLQNEQKAAETLSARLQAKEDEFKSLIDEKQSNWLEKEKQLQNQIKRAQKQIEELRTSNEVTERQLDNKNKHDPTSSASILAELDIVSRDANSSKQRIFELEKRNEELRRELSKSKNDVEINSIKNEFQTKVSELEGENALLLANLDQTRRKLADISKEHTAKVDANNREISRMNQEIKSLKTRLDQSSDYEEIKNELQLLKQIEFGYEEVSKDASESHIDSILVERNKALTQELAEHRSEHNDLLSRIQELETNLQASTQELNQAQMLNEKLENDLAAFQDVASSAKFNDNASLISGFSRVTRPIGGRNGSSVSAAGGSLRPEDASILPIITKQRDRFREKNNELEEELKKQLNLVNDLKRQVNSLKKDNEELYERTRYLASFNQNQQAQKPSSAARRYFNPKPNVDLENNQYQQLYESKLHPIERFRMREQERISSRLSPLERLFVSLTRAILATRTTRMLFMAYCVGLHVVVMCITVYAMNLNAAMIPEVGMNASTGGMATNQAGSPDEIRHALQQS